MPFIFSNFQYLPVLVKDSRNFQNRTVLQYSEVSVGDKRVGSELTLYYSRTHPPKKKKKIGSSFVLQEMMPSLLKPHVSVPKAAGFSRCSLMVPFHSFEPLMANYKQLPPQRGEPPWRWGCMDKMAISESVDS